MSEDSVWIEANHNGVSCLSPGRLIEPKITATFEGRLAKEFERLRGDRAFVELMMSAMRQASKQEVERQRTVGSKLNLVDGLEG